MKLVADLWTSVLKTTLEYSKRRIVAVVVVSGDEIELTLRNV